MESEIRNWNSKLPFTQRLLSAVLRPKDMIWNVLSQNTSWPIIFLCYQVLFSALSNLQLFHTPVGIFFFLRFLWGGTSWGSGVRGSLLSDCRRTAAWTMPSENQMKRSSNLNSEPLRNRQEKAAICYIVQNICLCPAYSWDENILARKYKSWKTNMVSKNIQGDN